VSDRALHRLGARDLAERLGAGTLTSAALVEHLLARIDALEPDLNALVAVHPQARAQARESDARRAAGAPRSALDGVPVIIKDNIEALGLPATAGSLAMAGSPAERDAALVQRLRAAGLVVLAAANLSEWANFRGRRSASGWSGVVGQTQNPWQVGRSPGGSSSGCGAALAAGYAPLAVGTETDGSITCPAALCGVVGLKPTLGSVPTQGVAPIAGSQDVPGPMARSVADAAALLEVLTAGAIAAPGAPAGPRRFVLGAPAAWRTGDPGTDGAFDAAVATMRAAGLTVVDVEVPADDEQVGVDEVAVLVHEMSDDLDAYLAGRPGSGPRNRPAAATGRTGSRAGRTAG
jgi:amidase